MSDYRTLGLAEGSGALPSEYLRAGKAAYEAWRVASGERDFAEWDQLVWAEQYAWLEAARAARAFT